MIYMDSLTLPDDETMQGCVNGFSVHTCYDSYYPFPIFYRRDMPTLHMEDITIFYGGNGSGKSTLLNVIAEKLNLDRDAVFNQSNFYGKYVDICDITLTSNAGAQAPKGSRIITSDDVFDYAIDVRCLNQNIDRKREERMAEYTSLRRAKFRMNSLEDLDDLRLNNLAKSKTMSQFVRNTVMDNVRERSNGETAFNYFVTRIKDHALYLLDEPENSLSTKLQIELRNFIIDSMRAFKCQFIIATHSPFMLSLPHAKIYNLDNEPPCACQFGELSAMRDYYELFKKHRAEFE